LSGSLEEVYTRILPCWRHWWRWPDVIGPRRAICNKELVGQLLVVLSFLFFGWSFDIHSDNPKHWGRGCEFSLRLYLNDGGFMGQADSTFNHGGILSTTDQFYTSWSRGPYWLGWRNCHVS
jgi:hypothetical protein